MTLNDVRETDVRNYWEKQSCGEVYAVGSSEEERFAAQSSERYRREPYIADFAKFHEAGLQRAVLEIGVGMGADHDRWWASPGVLHGIDLTARAVAWTKKRCPHSKLQVANAEALPYRDALFDVVYSWGVLHHTPNTPKAFSEVYRVLRPGGVARIMIYHTWSWTVLWRWLVYGAWRGLGPRATLSRYSGESPGTQAFSKREALEMCAEFSSVTMQTRNWGLFLMVEARK